MTKISHFGVESLRMKKGIRNTYERKVKEDVFILGRAPFP